MQLAVLLEHGGDVGPVIAHPAGDGDAVALGGLVEGDGHVVHLKAAVGQPERGPQQPGQVGVHLHGGQQQLLGHGVVGVVVKVALGLLDVVDAAPDGGLPQGEVVDVLDALKGQRVEQDQPFQLVLILLHLLGVVKQAGHQPDAGPQHGQYPDDQQHRHDQPQRLTAAAAVDACMFLRGHIGFHDLHCLLVCQNRLRGPAAHGCHRIV